MKKGIITAFLISLTIILSASLIGCGNSDQLNQVENIYESFKSDHPDIQQGVELSEDKNYVFFDTNPKNNPYFYDNTLDAAIEELIVDYFDFPKYVIDYIHHTSRADGRQTEETDNYIITWYYHPDKGLEGNIRIK